MNGNPTIFGAGSEAIIMMSLDEALAKLHMELETLVASHSPKKDSFFYNGGTVLALAATGTATLLPESLSLWARIAAAVATFVVALSRALDFGGRWRWHLQMRNAYSALIDRLNKLDVLPPGDQQAAAAAVYDDLVALRAQENSIPGAGSPTAG